MAKLTLTDISAGYNSLSVRNANNTLIEAAIENTLSRDGTAPNQMEAALDMNSWPINNLPDATNNQQPITLAQAASIASVSTAFSQENVGAALYPRTAEEISAGITPTNYYYEPGNVLRYGTNTSPGTTDMTTAISNAIDAMAAGGGTVYFPPGEYKITSVINKTFADGVHIRLKGDNALINGSTVTGVSAGDTDLIRLGGSTGTSSLLSASPARGDYAITTSSNIGSTANQFILLSSTDQFSAVDAAYLAGEIVEVESVATNTYSLLGALFDAYTAANTTAYALAMPTIEVEGLEIQMAANQRALVIKYAKNPVVRNCKVHGGRYNNIAFDYCVGGGAFHNDVYDGWYSGTGTSYGIAILGCQDMVVRDNYIRECRHCITTGGLMPARRITHVNNSCYIHPDEADFYAIDAHGNGEYIKILDNYAEGIIVGSLNTEVCGNKIYSDIASGHGINIFHGDDCDYFKVEGNTIEALGASSYGIWYSPRIANTDVTSISIRNNNIKTTGQCIFFQPRTSSITGGTITDFDIHDNHLTSTGSAQALSLQLNSAADITVSRLFSSNNIYNAEAYDAAYSTITVSQWYSTDDVYLSDRVNGRHVDIQGDHVVFTNCLVEGNTGGAGNGRSCSVIGVGGSGIFQMVGCETTNMTYRWEARTLGTVVEDKQISAIGSYLNTAGATIYGVLRSDGTTGGTGSAGAGNQYVELEVNGTTYKVLHDGTV